MKMHIYITYESYYSIHVVYQKLKKTNQHLRQMPRKPNLFNNIFVTKGYFQVYQPINIAMWPGFAPY